MTARICRWLVSVCAAGALALPATLQGAAFTNGSFETGPPPPPGLFTTLGAGDTSITGWTVRPTNIEYIGSYWTAEDGARSLDLSGGTAGGIEQTFDTTTGTRYIVTFYLAGNPTCAPIIKHVDVGATGNATAHYTFDVTGHDISSMGWQRESYTFVANGTSTTLFFQSQDFSTCGPALDNVSVAVAPSIPTLSPRAGAVLALLLAALGWMAFARRSAA
jgi:choice-of-anchor C domain-containing protein